MKASNVLLDENFEAQVADFGFAKLIPEGATHVTTGVKGTLGYLAPEYAMWGKVSESCDVYSFGILVLELISGKKPIERGVGNAKRTIVEWAGPLVLQGRYRDLADPKLQGKFDEEELMRLVQVMHLSFLQIIPRYWYLVYWLMQRADRVFCCFYFFLVPIEYLLFVCFSSGCGSLCPKFT